MHFKSVRLENVTKIFGGPRPGQSTMAVDDVSIDIAPGELVTILGPSGCGKTTILRMLSGFEAPTSGRVFIGGTDVTGFPPNKRDTAMVFQNYGLFPHMNVFDNVAYGLKLRKVKRQALKEKVMRFLDMAGLRELWNRMPSRLSGGQQQRAALARSLIVEPSVLLLDEPLSNLDALLSERMRAEIRDLQKSLSITALYVTHDRAEAMSLSDRIAVMNRGKIVQIGTPREIYLDPADSFVASLAGKASFFSCRVLATDEGQCEAEIGGRRFGVPKWSPELKKNDEGTVMCRPESLSLGAPGLGVTDGVVSANLYLGDSVESRVKTELGEIIVRIDNPGLKKIWKEGESVSLILEPGSSKILKC
jgi:iron(III) transport system ATP-binding protein